MSVDWSKAEDKYLMEAIQLLDKCGIKPHSNADVGIFGIYLRIREHLRSIDPRHDPNDIDLETERLKREVRLEDYKKLERFREDHLP